MTGIDRQASFRHWTASQSGPQGQVAEWLKAADCKSARVSVRWFESSPVHHPPIRGCPPNPLEMAENLAYHRWVGPLRPIPFHCSSAKTGGGMWGWILDRKSTRLNSSH